MQGTDVLEQEDRTYTSSGELKSITLNNAVTTEFKYDEYGLGGRRTREYRYAFDGTADNADDTVNLVSTTIQDWRGELVSRTGPGVVEEHRSESTDGVGRVLTTIALGPSGASLVSNITERDGLGRRTGQKASVPNGQWRTWSYDTFGRRTVEMINNETVRSWGYNPDHSVTETITPAPDPARTVNWDIRYVTRDGAVWLSQTTRDNVSPEDPAGQEKFTQQEKLTGFGAKEISVRRFRDHGGDWTTITTTIDASRKAMVETTQRPNVISPYIRKYRAGLLVWERANDELRPTTYQYDPLGRVVTVVDNNGAQTTTTYDHVFGQVASVDVAGNDGTSSSQSSIYYQPNETTPGLLKRQTVNGQETDYQWTARGELAATWGATYPVKYDYDAAGRLWKMHTFRVDPGTNPASWPAGDITEWVYYPGTMALQKKKDAANQGPVYEYDPRGWLSKRTWVRTYNGGALFTLYSHNRLGELTGINYNDTTPDVTISRDSKGLVRGVTDGTGGWTYAYDDKDRLEREICNATDSALIYQRDSIGRRTGYGYWDQSTGTWSTWGGWGFDAATGRINGVSTPEGWIGYRYLETTGQLELVQIQASESMQLTNERSYDGLGRLNSTSTSATGFAAPAPALTRTYTYDTSGRRNKMTDEDNDYWEYNYNGRGEAFEGKKKRGSESYPLAWQQFGYTFDAIGNRTSTSQYYHTTASRTYNSLNQASSGTNGGFVAIIGQADAASTTTVNGQPTSRNGMDFGATVSGPNGYYPRWASVNVIETKQGQPPTQTQTTGHVFIPSPYASIQYDEDGNLTQDDRWKYTWDAENRLIKQETKWQGANAVAGMPILRLEYKYDAHGRRVEKKVSTWNTLTNSFHLTRTTKFAYDRWNLIAEWDSPNPQPSTLNLIRTHHWGLDLSSSLGGAGGVGALVLSRYHQANGQTSSCVPAYDGNGNVIAMIDSVTGKRAAEYEYGPFGELLRSTGPLSSANPFRHSTKYQDDATGLLYYGYRYYSADAGRWIGRDPIGIRGGANLYGFVLNNPVSLIDILGLEGCGSGSDGSGESPKPNWHHDYPQEHEKFFKSKGIDIHEAKRGTIFEDPADHTGKGGIHPEGYNKDWDDWIEEHQDADDKEIEGFQRELREGKYKKQYKNGKPATKGYNEWKKERRTMNIKAKLRCLGTIAILCTAIDAAANADEIADNFEEAIDQFTHVIDDDVARLGPAGRLAQIASDLGGGEISANVILAELLKVKCCPKK
jgi:RHS repeat-associated protein